MASKKSAKPKAENPPVLPEYILNAPVMKKTHVSRKSLPRFQEQMHLVHAPMMLRTYYEALTGLAVAKDMAALRLIGEMFGLVKERGGVSVNTQILQANLTSGQATDFDSLIRQISDSRAHAVPLIQPPPAMPIEVEAKRIG